MARKEKITYKKAGVDIAEGDRFVRLIAPIAKKTMRKEVLTGIGPFGALFRLDTKKYKDPVLVSGTDGVGTKLKVAFLAGRHDTVGIDLVAMCVNDILTSGAEPLFFLDYFATGRLKAEKAMEVIEGIAAGCNEAGCTLIGGETAEMPGFYQNDEYDLAGFAVGAVERGRIIDGSGIKPGDAIIGLASSGLHSNGYSLARKVLLEGDKSPVRMKLRRKIRAAGNKTLAEVLLTPTRIYVKAFKAVLGKVKIKGMAHITGGGMPGNLNRMLPKNIDALVDAGAWDVPPVFRLIEEAGGVPLGEMRKTFNMGIGFAMAVAPGDAGRTVSLLARAGYPAFVIGQTVKGRGTVKYK
ncbi:MAG: phosphoribosylformylglycinamidine cyclo-ligase [Nitrospiraceae bacterium]|nr:phosphoribosylformylglycinamidine cyclo-ligase [Nitrospiraceae bacterium]